MRWRPRRPSLPTAIGDFGLLVAMFLIFWNFGSLDFATVFAAAPAIAAAHPTTMLLITLFMLLGVTGKSGAVASLRLAA